MSDMYREILIKRKTPASAKAAKAGMIAGTALFAVAGLIIYPLCLIPALALGIVTWIYLPRMDVEFEYLYVNGSLDIDRIFSKMKRKKAEQYELTEQLELLAPENSHELDHYRNGKKLPLKDYTSGEENIHAWMMVINASKGQELVRVELEDQIVQDIRRFAPRKVIIY